MMLNVNEKNGFNVNEDNIALPTGSNMSEISAYSTFSLTGSRALATNKVGDVLFVTAEGANRLTAIDISDPTSMSYIDHLTNANFDDLKDIIIDEDNEIAYVVSNVGDTELVSVDISNPLNMSVLDSINTGLLTAPNTVEKSGDYIIIIEKNQDSITMFDASDPSNLIKKDTAYATQYLELDVAISEDGNYAFSGGATDSYHVTSFNISDPNNIIEEDIISNVSYLNTPRGYAVSGNYLYVVSYHSDSIVSIDISDPSNMTIADTLIDATNLEGAHAIKIVGNVAFVVTTLSNHITSVDISDPTNMTRIDSFTNTNMDNIKDLAIVGNVAFVASFSGNRVIAVDIT